ncbi:hypothetical protein BV20DRAFT_592212 [Pilatotrama ljubarskyi]|nr:hypothetical protein BV20DRAFT_592212 [Pilatotrama ljubarskyi]
MRVRYTSMSAPPQAPAQDKGKQNEVHAVPEPEEVEEGDEWETSSLSSLSSLSSIASAVPPPPEADSAEGPIDPPRPGLPPLSSPKLSGIISEVPRSQSSSMPAPVPSPPSLSIQAANKPSTCTLAHEGASGRSQNGARGPSRELSYVDWPPPGHAVRPPSHLAQSSVQGQPSPVVQSSAGTVQHPASNLMSMTDRRTPPTPMPTTPSSTPPQALDALSLCWALRGKPRVPREPLLILLRSFHSTSLLRAPRPAESLAFQAAAAAAGRMASGRRVTPHKLAPLARRLSRPGRRSLNTRPKRVSLSKERELNSVRS